MGWWETANYTSMTRTRPMRTGISTNFGKHVLGQQLGIISSFDCRQGPIVRYRLSWNTQSECVAGCFVRLPKGAFRHSIFGDPIGGCPDDYTGRGGHSFTFIPSLRISTPSPNQGTSLDRIWLRVFNPQFQNGYHELRPKDCNFTA